MKNSRYFFMILILMILSAPVVPCLAETPADGRVTAINLFTDSKEFSGIQTERFSRDFGGMPNVFRMEWPSFQSDRIEGPACFITSPEGWIKLGCIIVFVAVVIFSFLLALRPR